MIFLLKLQQTPNFRHTHIWTNSLCGVCFFAETRSDVPAHGCVLSAAGNPVQRQIPVVPQTHCWICFVNAAVVSSFDYLCRRCSPLWFLITSGPVLTSVWVSVCVLSEPEVVSWLSAPSLPRRCSCSHRHILGRKRRRLKTTIVHRTTPTTSPVTFTHITFIRW